MTNQNKFNLTWQQYFCKSLGEISDFPWVWSCISYNPNITIDFVKKHIDKKWRWNKLSSNSFNGEKEKFRKKFRKKYIIQNCFPEHIPIELRINIMDLV